MLDGNVRSYDYSSPVSEAGEHGYHSNVDKYLAMQSTLLQHQTKADLPIPAEPALLPRTGYGSVKMTSAARVLDSLDAYPPPPPGARSQPVHSPFTVRS